MRTAGNKQRSSCNRTSKLESKNELIRRLRRKQKLRESVRHEQELQLLVRKQRLRGRLQFNKLVRLRRLKDSLHQGLEVPEADRQCHQRRSQSLRGVHSSRHSLLLKRLLFGQGQAQVEYLSNQRDSRSDCIGTLIEQLNSFKKQL